MIFKNIIDALTPNEKRRILLLAVANIFISLLDLFCIIFMLFVLKFYIEPNGQIFHNKLLGKIFSGTHSLLPAIALLLIFCIKNIGGHTIYKSQVQCINRVAVRLSEKNLREYLYGDYKNYIDKDSSLFIRNIIHQPTEFTQYVLLNFQMIISESIMILLSVTALIIYNANLFFIILCTLLPPVLILLVITKKRLAAIKKNIKTSVEKSLQYLKETLSGYVESNIFGKNEYFISRQTSIQSQLGKYVTGMQITQDLPARFFETFAVCGLFVLIVVAKYLSVSNGKYILIVGAFMAAAYKIIPGISKIINLYNQLQTYAHTAKEANKKPPVPSEIMLSSTNTIERISFKNISYAYNENKILESLSMQAYKGSMIGIYGNSGKGKTTMFNLLLGFLHSKSGDILINDTNLNSHNYLSFRKNISYAKQEPYILHASVLDNIVLFDKEYNKQKLGEILTATGIDKILENYPEGLDKLLFENGKNISGGQRQRIALARALYKDFDVLLLDEPFSELDESSEISMLKYLYHLAKQGKIVLLISHDKNCFDYCDAVINLNNYRSGEIIP